MKKRNIFYLSFIILILGLCFSSCTRKKDDNDDKDKDPITTTSFEVSIYDDGLNLISNYSFSESKGNTLDVSSFAKKGYIFEGIYDITTDVMLFNSKGTQSPLVMIDKNFVAVLKYTPVTYKIVFEAGDGKLENTTDYVRKISYNETLELFPSVTYEGKELDGWFDELGTRYSFGTSPIETSFTETGFNLDQESIKLYAHYEDKYYTVSLLYQNGTNDAKIKVKHGEKLPDLTEYFKDDGSRTIKGFGVSSSGTNVYDDPVYTDLELYAIWVDYKNVYFYYQENDTRVVKIFRDGSVATLPDGERTGYNFDGWYDNELLTGNKITNVSFGSLASIYYAKWEIGTYTISFVSEGKIISSSKFSIEDIDIFTPPVPAKPHYTGTWENYEIEYKDIIVNAIYKPEEYKITLMTGTDYLYITVTYGENYTLQVPKKKGYDFDGWYYKEEKVTDNEGKSLNAYTFDGAVSLTAHFTGMKCKLFFETNGGTIIDPVEVVYGTPYTITETPEREGFFFGGWFDETLVEEYIGSITLKENKIIYAKWIKSTEIYDVEGLKAISENPYGNYHLTTNINLRGEVWEPIENFSGILNGNGHKIYNFRLKKDNADLAFIIKNTGTIKNLSLSNIEFSSTIDENYSCSLSVFSAYNEGNLININIDNINALINIKCTDVTTNISFGTIVGENKGKIIAYNTNSSLIINTNLYANNKCSCYVELFVGGICGKNSSDVKDGKGVFNLSINNSLSAVDKANAWGMSYGVSLSYLHIGGICGYEGGTLNNSNANLNFDLSSNGSGTCIDRYLYVGGIAGSINDNASIQNCFADGNAYFTRNGSQVDKFETYTGGIVGKVVNGTVNNCASSVNLTLNECYVGYMAGIAGCVCKDGIVSNTAYYGEVKTITYIGGNFTGLVGLVEGVFTKSYFHGKITTDSENVADIAGTISTSGTVSKTISNGNIHKVSIENSGSSNDNIIIGVDYGADVLLDVNVLFEKLCLFEPDLWGVDPENGLYLISFPENNLPKFE